MRAGPYCRVRALAPGRGFEPRQAVPKAAVLPLDEPGIMVSAVGFEPTRFLLLRQAHKPILLRRRLGGEGRTRTCDVYRIGATFTAWGSRR